MGHRGPESTKLNSIQSRLMTLAHQDPVDRFLAATAVMYSLTPATADEHLLHSKEFATLPNK